MGRVLTQAVKEWRQFRRDRLSLALAGVLPVVGLLLFGLAVSLDADDLRAVVDDLDNSPLSRRYLDAWAATNDIVFVPRRDGAPLIDALDSGEAHLALLIPADFGRDLHRGAPVRVQVLIDGTDTNTATALRNVSAAVGGAFLRQLSSTAERRAVQADVRFWYNPGLSDRLFFGSGALALVLMLFPALLGALAVAREHELGTVVQVYASTLTGAEWMLGKLVTFVAIGLVELAICFAVGGIAFDYHVPSDPSGFLVGSLCYLCCAVLFGMAAGNLVRTQSAAIQAVQLGAFLISMLMSGFLVPLANIPIGLQWISYVLPATHYVSIVRGSLFRSGDWTLLGPSVGWLALITAVLFLINLRGMARLRRVE